MLLKSIIGNEAVYFQVSPYRRTRETLKAKRRRLPLPLRLTGLAGDHQLLHRHRDRVQLQHGEEEGR